MLVYSPNICEYYGSKRCLCGDFMDLGPNLIVGQVPYSCSNVVGIPVENDLPQGGAQWSNVNECS